MLTLWSRLGLCAALALGAIATIAAGPDPLRVLLVTGGHDFEVEPFLDVFTSAAGIAVTRAQHEGRTATAYERADLAS